MITPPDTPPSSPEQVPASGWNIQAPYAAGTPSAILVGGDPDPGGRDDVAGTVAGSVAAAQARYGEHETDTYGLGSVIGDVMAMPASHLDPAVTQLHGEHGTTPLQDFADPNAHEPGYGGQ